MTSGTGANGSASAAGVAVGDTAVQDTAVEVAGVSKRYGATVALADVSLAIPAGSSTAFVGPDGVGKSTLLAMIAGVRRIDAGTVRTLGADMAEARARDAAAPRIAYMPQGLGRNLYPTLSVFENIDFFARLFGQGERERRARIAHLLRATGLDPFPDRPAGKLSGGMKQKLSLCCALIHDPDLLILDEPTTGVDPLSRRQFWALIGEIKAERPGMTVLVATAYMEEAETFPRLVAMDAGRVLAHGATAEVIAETGAASLEGAYVRLQNPEAAREIKPLVLPPRTAHDGPPAIRAEGLTRRFGDFVAVDHVSFSIERGEIFGFLGSNGCGKTTTMKMLTGLLGASEGTAELLGHPVEANDIKTRMRVGYMSQAFSLYEELTVRANLTLHAQLYRVPDAEVGKRVDEALAAFDLDEAAEAQPASLPLGIRQRLQLAAACLHRPEVLILDEPTSGVDPAARDLFWRLLGDLSRRDGVTIFVSTHFMNEAERCDRISFMHAGRVLAVGTPDEVRDSRHAPNLEEAFVAYLKEAAGSEAEPVADGAAIAEAAGGAGAQGAARPDKAFSSEVDAGSREENAGQQQAGVVPRFAEARHHSSLKASFGRIWAFARREMLELLRDKVRLAFALLGPLLLMVTFGFGITFDVEDLPFAVYDRDQSIESRQFIESFAGSRYFQEQPPVREPQDIDRRLRSGELRVVIDIPPSFGRDLLTGRKPEVAFFLDGAPTFRAETTRGYVDGIVTSYVADLARRTYGTVPVLVPIEIEPRFRYNQAFLSVVAITPGVVMILLLLIPAMLTALGVVREREIGSIANFYAAPASRAEFLIGKQMPYVLLGFVSFLSLMVLVGLLFGVTVKGSFAALTFAALLYVFAGTALGILVSTFVSSQVAAIIGTAIVTTVPAVNFSGFLYPASTLEGGGRYAGFGFPALWFQNVSLGTITKARDFGAFHLEYLVLFGFGLVYLTLAALILRKQES